MRVSSISLCACCLIIPSNICTNISINNFYWTTEINELLDNILTYWDAPEPNYSANNIICTVPFSKLSSGVKLGQKAKLPKSIALIKQPVWWHDPLGVTQSSIALHFKTLILSMSKVS